MVGATFAGWEFKYNALFKTTTFKKERQQRRFIRAPLECDGVVIHHADADNHATSSINSNIDPNGDQHRAIGPVCFDDSQRAECGCGRHRACHCQFEQRACRRATPARRSHALTTRVFLKRATSPLRISSAPMPRRPSSVRKTEVSSPPSRARRATERPQAARSSLSL
jgi:hypothetical protein